MKSYLKSCLFFLIVSTSCWCQEKEKTLEITYIRAYKNFRDTTNTAPKVIKNIQYKLICNSNEARFEILPLKEKKEEPTYERFLHSYRNNSIYYKNIKENLKILQTENPLDDKKYLVKMPFNRYNWVITKEKKEILGYTCYKAYAEYENEFEPYKYIGVDTTIKIKVEVWFAPELNYPFGPNGFDGLPGLVLEKYVGSFYLIASKISLKDSTDINIVKPQEGIDITYDESIQLDKRLYRKYFED